MYEHEATLRKTVEARLPLILTATTGHLFLAFDYFASMDKLFASAPVIYGSGRWCRTDVRDAVG